MAFYAIEATAAPAKEVADLSAKVVSIFMRRHTTRRSQDLFWAVCATNIISPSHYACRRRCDAVRDACERWGPAVRGSLDVVLKRYADAGYVCVMLEGTGIFRCEQDL